MRTERRRAWITGAGGLIGNQLVECSPAYAPDWTTTPIRRDTVDLTNFSAVQELFQTQKPDLIIHCAAKSRSPDCQRDPVEARRQNVDVTHHLARLAENIPLVFMSTDLVFDGRKGSYIESDPPNPMNVYAETKLESERLVLTNPNHLVIRTSLNAGPSPTRDRGMDEQLIRAWRSGVNLCLFEDEFRCPIPASATARAIWELIALEASGLFHIAGSEVLSRWQIGELLTDRHPEFRHLISRGSLKDYEGAPRSPDTTLACGKAQAMLGFDLPKFSDWLNNERIRID